jgi:hypothetical protein
MIEFTNRIERSDLKKLSDALDVLRDQGSKSNQVDAEWDRRFDEISALFEKEYKQFQGA